MMPTTWKRAVCFTESTDSNDNLMKIVYPVHPEKKFSPDIWNTPGIGEVEP